MNSKALNILLAACLVAVVGVMSWQDMHPKAGAGRKETAPLLVYHAGEDIAAALIPNDSRPVTIAQGAFDYAPDGRMLWTPRGMPPATLAQRQVNLLLHFDSLPQDPAETLRKIQDLVKDWERQGTEIFFIFLEYGPEKPDFASYAALLKEAAALLGKSHRVMAAIDAAWLEDSKKDGLRQVQEQAPLFLISAPEPRISPELLSGLRALERGFILRFPAGTVLDEVDFSPLAKTAAFLGCSLTLDSHKPWREQERKVGLFPKL